MKTFNHLYIIIFLIAIAFTANAQKVALKVGTNPSTIDPSAVLELESTTKGFLPPRINLTGTLDVSTIASPATGLTVYNKTAAGTAPNNVLPGFYYWNGTKWMATSGDGSNNWSLTGNAGTMPATNFIGTTDAQDLVLKTNNIEKMRVTSDGNVGIGTAAPSPFSVLETVGEGGSNRRIFVTNYSNSAVEPSVVRLRKGRGTIINPLTLQANDIIGNFTFSGYNGSNGNGFINNFPPGMWSTATENWTTTANGSNLTFMTIPNGSTTSSTRMTITDAGFVGIGTTTPDKGLEIVGLGGAFITSYSNGPGNPGVINLRKSRGTEAAPLAVLNNDHIGMFGFTGYNGSSWLPIAATNMKTGMGAFAAENWSLGKTGTYLNFQTIPNGTDISIPRMTITDAGLVGIGTSTPRQALTIGTDAIVFHNGGDKAIGFNTNFVPAFGWQKAAGSAYQGRIHFTPFTGDLSIISSSGTNLNNTQDNRIFIQGSTGNVGIGTVIPGESLDVNGVIRGIGYRGRAGLGGATSSAFNLYWNGTNTHLWIDYSDFGAITTTSDRRLKENINSLANTALDRVMSLHPVSYNYKKINEMFSGSTTINEGFIADELQEIIPSAVNGEKNALTKEGMIQPQTLNMAPVVSVLTKAVQEQQAQINELKSQIEELKALIKVKK